MTPALPVHTPARRPYATAPPTRPVPRPADPRVPASLRRPPVDLELIIPAYNEEGRLPGTIDATVAFLAGRPWSSAVVVVDNNSSDATGDIVERFPHPRVPLYTIGCSDPGKGAAVRRGLLTSTARFVGFEDADSATPIGTLDQVMALLTAGHSAVIASRLAAGARYEIEQPLLRRCGGWAFRALAHRALPGIADTQCGFKFFDGPLVRAAAVGCRIDGFAFDVELLARLARRGADIVEVPVAWTDMPGSTFSARRDGLHSMADLVRLSLTR
ncbi:glycosyltransferase [Streptomyces sp. NPDC058486]|uniref:glycosyltransferase n=1 Tax=unclassified Streptomyces TaxID=2593676 RepID=UPI00364F76F2